MRVSVRSTTYNPRPRSPGIFNVRGDSSAGMFPLCISQPALIQRPIREVVFCGLRGECLGESIHLPPSSDAPQPLTVTTHRCGQKLSLQLCSSVGTGFPPCARASRFSKRWWWISSFRQGRRFRRNSPSLHMMLRSSPRHVDASECDLRQGDAEMVGEPLAAQGSAESATPARVAVPSPSHEFFVKGAVIEDGVDGVHLHFPRWGCGS